MALIQGRGRKAIPTQILDLMGGTEHTHRPPRSSEPRPPEKIPSCPKYLDPVARKEWKRASKILGGVGILTEADLAVFASYCQYYSAWLNALKHIESEGTIISVQVPVTQRKSHRKDAEKEEEPLIITRPMVNPYIKIANDYWDRMMKACVQLGMSPVSRASLHVDAKPKQKSKIEEFRDRKKSVVNGEE